MSDPLALSAVSAVLQFYLFNMYTSVASAFGGQPAVTSQAPDLVQQGLTKPENQINLFLHQVTYNASWRNVALPSVAADGKTRLTSPPLALDLHYLLTAYGSADWQAEGLLGCALMMLHENSIITRDDGSKQWAWKGKPLYYWVKDGKPGDKTGDGFNKVWQVAKP